MRLLRSVLLVSSCLLSSVSTSMLDGAAVPDVDGDCATTAISPCVSAVYTMGFEAETSVFKMRGDTPKRVFIDVVKGKELWEFTVDTPDSSVNRTDEDGDFLNTECRTMGGLNKQEIQEAAQRVTCVWQKIKEECKDKYDTFVVIPEGVFSEIPTSSFQIRMPNAGSHQRDEQVYPQLTYCLPLSQVHLVFKRIASLNKTHGMSRLYLQAVESNIDSENLLELQAKKDGLLEERQEEINKWENEILELQKKLDENTVKLANIEDDPLNTNNESTRESLNKSRKRLNFGIFLARTNQLGLLLPVNAIDNKIMCLSQSQLMKSSKELLDNAQSRTTLSLGAGLAYLVTYYVYELFSKNVPKTTTEPGPKPVLGVMSRLPFSEMYDNLEQKDQDEFKNLISQNLIEYFEYKICEYKTGLNMRLRPNELVTLGQWYESIIDSAKREEGRDLLSPPPGCRDHPSQPQYGMGAYRNKKELQGNALVEIRAYSRLSIDGSITTLDKFSKLVKDESDWFFALESTQGESL